MGILTDRHLHKTSYCRGQGAVGNDVYANYTKHSGVRGQFGDGFLTRGTVNEGLGRDLGFFAWNIYVTTHTRTHTHTRERTHTLTHTPEQIN